jgi:hypothetical protein
MLLFSRKLGLALSIVWDEKGGVRFGGNVLALETRLNIMYGTSSITRLIPKLYKLG